MPAAAVTSSNQGRPGVGRTEAGVETGSGGPDALPAHLPPRETCQRATASPAAAAPIRAAQRNRFDRVRIPLLLPGPEAVLGGPCGLTVPFVVGGQQGVGLGQAGVLLQERSQQP